MDFRFACPFALALIFLPFIPVVYRRWREQQPSLMFSDNRLFDGLPTSRRLQLRRVPEGLRLIVWGVLIVALARPQSGEGDEIIRGQGIDIVLAIDISTSMAALDFEPYNRLDAAKAVIGDFIARREFDRIGLVAFARNAYHQAPLTLDYEVLRELLDDIRLLSELREQLDGSAIGLGLASSANMLRSSDAPSKVIILLTDGANNAGIDPITAAQAVATLGIRIYTIGMGRPGEVPVITRNAEGIEERAMIESDLNEESLRRIATIGNGAYFRAEDRVSLERVYDQINQLERSSAERIIFVQWQDHAIWFIGFALIVLVAELVLRETVFRSLP